MIGALFRLWRLCEPERPRLVAGFAVAAVASLLGAVPVVLLAVVVDRLVAERVDDGLVVGVALIAVASMVARFLLAWRAHALLWVLAYRVAERLRNELCDRVLAEPPARSAGPSRAETLTVLTADAGKIAGFLAWELPTLVGALLGPLVVLVAMAWFDPVLALLAAVMLAFAVPTIRFALGRIEEVMDRRRRAEAASTAGLLEYVRGIEVIRALGRGGQRQRVLADALAEVRDADVDSVVRITPAYSAFNALIDAGFAVVVAVVAWRVAQGAPDGDGGVAALAAPLVLATALYRPMIDVGHRALHLPELATATRHLVERFAEPLPPPRLAVALPERIGVQLDRVSCRYPGRDHLVLEDLSLEVRPGTMTALVGPSGAGKSTVLRLVAGLLDAEEGSVRLGGVDLADMAPAQSASLVTAVFQDVGVLRGTVGEAIGTADASAGPVEIAAAARAARIHDRIVALPAGYDTPLGEAGRGLSGGERQRVAIARALLKDAPIVLLDEASSALDPINERLVREALAELVAERAVLVVAHRLETIRSADHIVVLVDGRIAEAGVHDELVDAGGVYARSWRARQRAAEWRLVG